jgi:hypothetical protein
VFQDLIQLYEQMDEYPELTRQGDSREEAYFEKDDEEPGILDVPRAPLVPYPDDEEEDEDLQVRPVKRVSIRVGKVGKKIKKT